MDINLRRVKTVGEMRALMGDGSLECQPVDRESVCELVQWILARFGYGRPGRGDKGVGSPLPVRFTGLSKAQLDRRIRQHLDTGRVADLRAGNSGRPFERVYTRGDAVLPAEAAGHEGGAGVVHEFTREALSPFPDHHRPCLFPEIRAASWPRPSRRSNGCQAPNGS